MRAGWRHDAPGRGDPMNRATKVIPAGQWSTLSIDTVELDFEARHRRRITLKGLRGFEFLLDLPEAMRLRNGDGLELEDGRIVLVKAMREPLAEITAAGPADLARLAWHLGNRHLPVQVLDGRLRIRHDHVIEDMLRGLGATVTEVKAAFDPEGGAYDTHHHTHANDHEHEHG
jgi:urease accessory protein